jgi:hypothetical protein
MKPLQLRALSPALMCALMCALGTPPAHASPPNQGSKVLVPAPKLLDYGKKSAQPAALTSKSAPAVWRLPTQAGKVSKTLPANFVPHAQYGSFIAKGDRYLSLCTPKRDKVACAPLVPTRTMTDLEVGAVNAADGTALVTFTPARGSRRTAANLTAAIERFNARLAMQTAHFERQAILTNPTVPGASLRAGTLSSVADAGGGGCSYDDFGGYDCAGGGSEGGGGGGGGGYDPDPSGIGEGEGEWGGCYGECNYPGGNENGDPAPGTDQNGDPIVVVIPGQREPQGEPDPYTGPIVVITGQRPVPDPVIIPIPNAAPIEIVHVAGPAGCVLGPRRMWICPPAPPAGGIPQLPRPPRRWWEGIDWCGALHIGCPIANNGNGADAARQAERARKEEICKVQAAVHGQYCEDMDKYLTTPNDPMWYPKCIRDMAVALQECMMLAKGDQIPR